MNYLIQRIQSYLATTAEGQEKVNDLLIELRHRGLHFDIRFIDEDGQKYFYAESVGYPRGHISATGETMQELESELKDAIFTAFSVPPRFCFSNLIVFSPPLAQTQTVGSSQKIYASI